MKIEKLRELQKVMTDSQTPMSTRMQAAARYDELLAEAACEMNKQIDQIKTGGNEIKNVAQ